MWSPIRAELRKLTTVRAPWLLLAAGPLIVVAGISGLVSSGANVSDPAVQARAMSHVGLAALFTLVFGILAVAGEYRHQTITDSYLSFPRRRALLLAKLVVYGVTGAAAGLAAAATAVVVTAIWWAAKGATVQLSSAATWQVLGGGIAANAAFAVIGVGVGALLRNVIAAVAAALAWIALIEGIAGQLLGSGLARWLPFYASEALDRASLTPATGRLPQWGGGLVLLGYAVAFAGAAVLSTLNRDVT
jgi:ABC-2 type transport system permease protein